MSFGIVSILENKDFYMRAIVVPHGRQGFIHVDLGCVISLKSDKDSFIRIHHR